MTYSPFNPTRTSQNWKTRLIIKNKIVWYKRHRGVSRFLGTMDEANTEPQIDFSIYYHARDEAHRQYLIFKAKKKIVKLNFKIAILMEKIKKESAFLTTLEDLKKE